MNGDTLHPSTLEDQVDAELISLIEAIELGDGIAGGGEEAERVHEHPIDNAG